MNDKLIIKLPKEHIKPGCKTIKVSYESYEKLMSLKKETGLPPHKLLDLILDFALKRIEVKAEN